MARGPLLDPLTVLLVQPPGDSLDLYSEYLQQQRVTCVPATCTADALAVAPRADVVVTGILLPGSGDGIELIERLRADERTRSVPIIVLTACVFDSERERARAAGSDSFLGKPCLPSDLYDEIRRVVAHAKLRSVQVKPAKTPDVRRPTNIEKTSGR